ncbi:MAG: PD-(D/E)XK nuclease family protein, partial [Flammeovirgaceae bacterium]|nr:PD-(D/E)XK nuclease family protein [Flammeovirgaceae bacterium]
MKAFLQELAEKLYQEKHPDQFTLVFPNRRAAFYFRKYFAKLLDRPVFSPTLITIEEFIGRFSTLKVPDKLELIYRLYKSYYQALGKPDLIGAEPFDQFYFWGEMLLRDFDEVDKYMVNAKLLFTDLSKQKELDSRFDFLTPEQIEYLKSFWDNFDHTKEFKQKFLNVWQRLPEVYQLFRNQLLEENLAYEGLVHRIVAEKFDNGEIKLLDLGYKNGSIWFVGFNALTKSEEKILSSAVSNNEAVIHWDLDAYYLNNINQEAGEFFREYQNHSILGKTFSDSPSNFKNRKTVSVIGAAQPVGQAKVMSQLLREELDKGINPEETLIVLPDEKLMLPVLHGISSSVDKLNVTMGFPLSNTPMFNLIELLIELQTHHKGDFYNHKHVLALLGHPYVVAADPRLANEKRKHIQKENIVFVMGSMLRMEHILHKEIFYEVQEDNVLTYIRQIIQLIGSTENIDPLDKEYATYFLKFLNRIEDVLGAEYSSLKAFLKLFRQLLKAQKIPFTGEPLRGLQVMGVLETRNLDFKNVFLLSLNEGSLPSSGSKGSYIPYNIRKAYQLPTPEHQDAIYAYLFYRVLQRAENIFLFYNSETDVLGQGEMSRYLQQLIFESGLTVDRNILHNPIQPLAINPITISKDQSVLDALAQLNERMGRSFKGISPSALNMYIDCRLKFYFSQVAGIKEPREVEEDINARVMGNFLHKVMEHFYKQLQERKKSVLVEKSDFEQLEKVVDQLIELVFIEQYKLERDKKVVFEGQQVIVKEVVKKFAINILEKDKTYTPFFIEGVEHSGMLYSMKINQPPGFALIGGNIDRVDRKDNLIRIIDYKTGKDRLDFDSIESLFVPSEKRNKAAFQILLYSLLYKNNTTHANEIQLRPGLLNRLNLFDDSEFGLEMNQQPLLDVLPLLPEFKERLGKLIEEIFNPAESFHQTPIVETCRYCPYKEICYR